MDKLWQRIRQGKHAAFLGALGPAPHDLCAVRVSCDLPQQPLGPILLAQKKVDDLLGGPPPLLDQAAGRVLTGLRRHLLGEMADEGPAAAAIESWNRLEQKAHRRPVLIFEAVEAADGASLGVLRQVLARPGWLRLPVVLVFRSSMTGAAGAAAALLELLRTTQGEEALMRSAEPAAPSGTGGGEELVAQQRLPAGVLRVLRACALAGSGSEAELLGRLLRTSELEVLELFQQAADAGVPVEDRGEGRVYLPEALLGALRGTILPSLARAWHQRLAALLTESSATAQRPPLQETQVQPLRQSSAQEPPAQPAQQSAPPVAAAQPAIAEAEPAPQEVVQQAAAEQPVQQPAQQAQPVEQAGQPVEPAQQAAPEQPVQQAAPEQPVQQAAPEWLAQQPAVEPPAQPEAALPDWLKQQEEPPPGRSPLNPDDFEDPAALRAVASPPVDRESAAHGGAEGGPQVRGLASPGVSRLPLPVGEAEPQDEAELRPTEPLRRPRIRFVTPGHDGHDAAPPQHRQDAPAADRGNDARAAVHLRAAGEAEAAARRLLLAVRHAADVGAFGQAVAYCHQALELLDELPAAPRRRLLTIEVFGELGRLQAAAPGAEFTLTDALSSLLKAKGLLEEGDPVALRAAISAQLSSVYYDLGDIRSLEQALVELTDASRALQAAGDAYGAARLLNDQAAVHVRIGDPVQAAHLLEQSREVFENRADSDPVAQRELAETYHLLARLPLHVGARPGKEAEALQMSRRYAGMARAVYRRLEDARGLGRVAETMGRVELRAGRLAEAAQHLSAAVELQQAVGDALGLARSTAALAEVLTRDGQHEQALQLLGESVALNMEKGSPLGLAFNRRGLEALAGSQQGSRVLQEVSQRLQQAEAILGRVHPPGV